MGAGGAVPGSPCQDRPKLIHYCYPHNVKSPVGHWIWNKYRMPLAYGVKGALQWSNEPLFRDCDMPLLEDIPSGYLEATGMNDFDRHLMWLMDMIIKSFNAGTLEVRRLRCKSGTIETRKLLRVTEDFSYVPAEQLRDVKPLSRR